MGAARLSQSTVRARPEAQPQKASTIRAITANEPMRQMSIDLSLHRYRRIALLREEAASLLVPAPK
jgi:hypothetical protein